MARLLPTVVHGLNPGTESKNINIYKRPIIMGFAAEKQWQVSC
jgi:hypothetical protein